jgi:hypothetical protein
MCGICAKYKDKPIDKDKLLNMSLGDLVFLVWQKRAKIYSQQVAEIGYLSKSVGEYKYIISANNELYITVPWLSPWIPEEALQGTRRVIGNRLYFGDLVSRYIHIHELL